MPANAGCISCVFSYYIHEHFHSQYWNERDMQWKGCGVSSTDLAIVQLRMRGKQQQHVRFRIERELIAG